MPPSFAQIARKAGVCTSRPSGALRLTPGVSARLRKAGPYIGPRGGKWADPAHTRPWKAGGEESPKAAESVAVHNALVRTVEGIGLEETIEQFNSAGDRVMYFPGGDRLKASEAAALLQAWRPPPFPKGSDLVTVNHSTDAQTAERFLRDGVIPQLKPWTQASRNYAEGKQATFAPGAGVERGLYVGTPDSTDGFGRVTLAIKVPREWITLPAEVTRLGDSTTEDALRSEHGGLVRQAIPASAISHATAKAFSGYLDLLKAAKGEARSGHKYIRREPKPGGGWRYYYADSAAARTAKRGDEIKVGDETAKVQETSDEGLTIEHQGQTRNLTWEEWRTLLGTHYGDAYHKWAERKARSWASAVLRHVPRTLLLDVDNLDDLRERVPDVFARLEKAWSRAGVDEADAKRIIGHTLLQQGWSADARAALLGAATDVEHRAYAMQSYRRISRAAGNVSRGRGADEVAAGHVYAAMEMLRSPRRAHASDWGREYENVAKDAVDEVRKLNAMIRSALKGQSNEAAAEVLRAALQTPAMHRVMELAQAFPGLGSDDSTATKVRETKNATLATRPGEPRTEGAEDVLYMAGRDGMPETVRCQYRLMEAGEVIPSHRAGSFQKHDQYPEGIQERVYHDEEEGKEERGKVLRNAAGLRPRFVVNTNPDGANGAPVVLPSGVVLGGNSRTMSLQMVYDDEDKAKADEHRTFLAKHAHEFGLRPEDVQALKNPILVRQIDEPEDSSPENLRVLVRQLNESFTQGMDPRTEAVAMSTRLDHEAVLSMAAKLEPGETLNGFLDSKRAGMFQASLSRVGLIDARNSAKYVSRSRGTLNAAGKKLVANLMLGRIVGDPDIMGDTDPRLLTSLEGSVVHMVRAVKAGPSYDLATDFQVAMSGLNSLKAADRVTEEEAKKGGKGREPMTPDEWLAQQDLFEQHAVADNPRARTLLDVLFYVGGSTGGAAKQLASVFSAYGDAARQNPEGQDSLFGVSLSPQEVWQQTVADSVVEARANWAQKREEAKAKAKAKAAKQAEAERKKRAKAEARAKAKEAKKAKKTAKGFSAALGLAVRDRLRKGGGPSGSGWQEIPGGKHGGKRRRDGSRWTYWYPDADAARAAHAHHQSEAASESAHHEAKELKGAEAARDWKREEANEHRSQAYKHQRQSREHVSHAHGAEGYLHDQGHSLEGKKGIPRHATADYRQHLRDPWPHTVEAAGMVTSREVAKWEASHYFTDGKLTASSRTNKMGAYPWKVGDWQIDSHRGIYGHEVTQLVELPISAVTKTESMVEGDEEGRGTDAARYAEWLEQGNEPPPIRLVQSEDGSLRVTDGHRRIAAHAIAGRQVIRAWISPNARSGMHDSQGHPMITGLTHEIAIHDAILRGESVPRVVLDAYPGLERTMETAREDYLAKHQMTLDQGWQRVPGGHKGGERRPKGGGWEYRYPEKAKLERAKAEAMKHRGVRRLVQRGQIVSVRTLRQRTTPEPALKAYRTYLRALSHDLHARGKKREAQLAMSAADDQRGLGLDGEKRGRRAAGDTRFVRPGREPKLRHYGGEDTSRWGQAGLALSLRGRADLGLTIVEAGAPPKELLMKGQTPTGEYTAMILGALRKAAQLDLFGGNPEPLPPVQPPPRRPQPVRPPPKPAEGTVVPPPKKWQRKAAQDRPERPEPAPAVEETPEPAPARDEPAPTPESEPSRWPSRPIQSTSEVHEHMTRPTGMNQRQSEGWDYAKHKSATWTGTRGRHADSTQAEATLYHLQETATRKRRSSARNRNHHMEDLWDGAEQWTIAAIQVANELRDGLIERSTTPKPKATEGPTLAEVEAKISFDAPDTGDSGLDAQVTAGRKWGAKQARGWRGGGAASGPEGIAASLGHKAQGKISTARTDRDRHFWTGVRDFAEAAAKAVNEIRNPAPKPDKPLKPAKVAGGQRPPGAGWQPIPKGKKGGYRRPKAGGGWEYWYPDHGVVAKPHADEPEEVQSEHDDADAKQASEEAAAVEEKAKPGETKTVNHSARQRAEDAGLVAVQAEDANGVTTTRYVTPRNAKAMAQAGITTWKSAKAGGISSHEVEDGDERETVVKVPTQQTEEAKTPDVSLGGLVEIEAFKVNEDRPPNFVGLDVSKFDFEFFTNWKGYRNRRPIRDDEFLEDLGFWDAVGGKDPKYANFRRSFYSDMLAKRVPWDRMTPDMRKRFGPLARDLCAWWSDLTDSEREQFWDKYVDPDWQWMVGKTTDPRHENETLSIPQGMEGFAERGFDFHAFQRKAINFAADHAPRAVWAMEMGLGKTLSAIGLYHKLRQRGEVDQMIVTAPLSAHGSWEDHFADFSDARVLVLTGADGKKRKRSFEAFRRGEVDVLVLSHHTVQRKLANVAPKDAFTVLDGAGVGAEAEFRGGTYTKQEDGRWEDKRGRSMDGGELSAEFVSSHDQWAASAEYNRGQEPKLKFLAHDHDVIELQEMMRERGERTLRIIDETHKFKNPTTALSRGLWQSLTETPGRVIGMTGTPKPNKVDDFFHITEKIAPGSLGGRLSDFAKRYCYTIESGQSVKILGFRPEALGALYKDSAGVMFARTTADPDAKLNLPERRDLSPPVPQDDVQREIQELWGHYAPWRKMANSKNDEKAEIGMRMLEDALSGELGPLHRAAAKTAPYLPQSALARAQHLAVDPALLDDEWANDMPDYESPKMGACADAVLEHQTQNPDKASVVFCEWNRGVAAMRRALLRRGFKEDEIGIYTGDTSKKQRRELEARLNQEEKTVGKGKDKRKQLKVLIGNTGALETGANLQRRANFVVHLNTPWAPDKLTQSTARVYRQGQRSKVTVLRPTGSEVEALIEAVVSRKIMQASQATGRTTDADAHVAASVRKYGKAQVTNELLGELLGIDPSVFVLEKKEKKKKAKDEGTAKALTASYGALAQHFRRRRPVV